MKGNIPSYEEFIGHRKLTLKQHRRQQKKYEEAYNLNKVEDVKDVVKPGRCACGSGEFKLHIKDRVMYRTCKKCSEERVV